MLTVTWCGLCTHQAADSAFRQWHITAGHPWVESFRIIPCCATP